MSPGRGMGGMKRSVSFAVPRSSGRSLERRNGWRVEQTLILADPLTGSRGLVPKSEFEEFIKGGRTASGGGSGRPGSSEPVR